MNNHTALDFVKKELKSVQIATAPTEDGLLMGDQIVKALEKHGKYVLILVDEFDELYRAHESKDEKIQLTYRTCMLTLDDLNWLGNQKTGRFAVLLCGSSASCPLLVTLDADRIEFPLQYHSPNGTKYKTCRRPVNPFLDTDFMPNCTVAQGKLITFCVGLNPRKYATLAQAVQEETDLFSAFHYGNHESGIGLASSPALEFRDKLLTKLREINQTVFAIIKDDMINMVNAHKVMESDWISYFDPLAISEVKSVWFNLNNNLELGAHDSLQKMYTTVLL